jgi:hypothetical protein
VQRRELRELPQPLLDGVDDEDRLAELRAPVHHPVRDGVGGGEALDRTRLPVLDQRELEARRAGVDD